MSDKNSLASRKSQAALISTLFLVVTVCAIGIWFIHSQTNLFYADYNLENRLMRFDLADQVRRNIFDCYGYPLARNLSNYSCYIPIGREDVKIKGIIIDQLKFGFCENLSLMQKIPENYEDTVTYLIPIRNKALNCPGKLVIYI